MTYEDIYQAISREMYDVFDHYEKVVKPKVDRFLKTSELFPARKSIEWKHPKTLNTYYYFVQSNRRSQWDNPFLGVLCEYEGKHGKELLIFVPSPVKNEMILHVFTSHFYERYSERFLNGTTDYYLVVSQYLMRNIMATSLGKECVSIKEQQEEIPGYKKESMLTLDGLGLGLRSNDKRIVIYKTFISFDRLFDAQFKKVWPIYLYAICSMAIESDPRAKVTINSIYENAVKEIRRLAEDPNLSQEEKCKRIDEEYGKAYHMFVKHIL